MNTAHPAPTANTTAPGEAHPVLIRFALPATTRRPSIVAGVLWFGLALSTEAWWGGSYSGDDWQPWYGLSCLLLGSAAGLTAAATISATWRGSTQKMETPGVAITVFAVCTTIIAFALPLWAIAIACGYVVFAIEARGHRLGVAMLAVAQLAGLAGLAVLLIAEAAELGPTDDVGEHPLPLTAVLTSIALVLLNRARRQPAPNR